MTGVCAAVIAAPLSTLGATPVNAAKKSTLACPERGLRTSSSLLWKTKECFKADVVFPDKLSIFPAAANWRARSVFG